MKHDGGFTLIEVLVAISIMALVMAGLTSMGVTTIGADSHSRRQSVAVNLAQAKLEELRVLRRSHADWAAGVHHEINMEEDGAAYTREWEVETDYNGYTRLSRVTVTVSWDDGTSGSVSVSSLYW
jgi:prepilin-type N-terminal cleavage/methylation domain-containing protein